MSRTDVDHAGRLIPDASWPPGKEAPGRLERVRRFINTTNLESGADRLQEPDRAAAWLGAEGWSSRLGDGELAWLREFREALRDVVTRTGRTTSWASLPLDTARLAVVFEPDGPMLVGTGYRAHLVANDLLAIVVDARASGTWSRLRTCANHRCRWAYFDRSRSGTGQWCSMTACGQRQKMRRYRSRHRTNGRVTA
jgi:predicted RNA-binding Zn ribbon-like protein